MSHRKRAASGAEPGAKKTVVEGKSTEQVSPTGASRLEISLAETKKTLDEVRSRYRALKATNDTLSLREHERLLRPAIVNAMGSWIKEHAFPGLGQITVAVTEVSRPAIGRYPFLCASDLVGGFFARGAFDCELLIDLKLYDQRVMQAARDNSIQQLSVLCALNLCVAPSESRGTAATSSLLVDFRSIDRAELRGGSLLFSTRAPYSVTSYQVLPTTVAAAAHLTNVLFYSHHARYALLERVWALASFVVPDSDPAQRVGAESLRKLFTRQIRLDSEHYSSIFGGLDQVCARMDLVGNKLQDDASRRDAACPLDDDDE